MIDRRLQVLRVLHATGTVAATAEALGYTPSAVSAQLRSLARDVGVAVLAPDGRRVKLTAAGRVLVSRAEELFQHWDEVRAEVVTATGEVTGELRMCGFSTAAAALLPAVATRVAAAYPRVGVRIIEANPATCFDLLLTDRADVAVVIATREVPPRSDHRFEQRSLLRDPLDLLLAADHPLAARTSVTFAEVAEERWIVDREGSAYHQLFLTACASAGFVPTIAHNATEWDAAAALVGAGLGCALVPRLARLPAGYAVVRLPLHGDPSPERHILTGIRRGSDKTPLIARALTELEDVAGSLDLAALLHQVAERRTP